RFSRDWSSDVCSPDLATAGPRYAARPAVAAARGVGGAGRGAAAGGNAVRRSAPTRPGGDCAHLARLPVARRDVLPVAHAAGVGEIGRAWCRGTVGEVG